MKRWKWFLIFGLIGIAGVIYYFLTSPDYMFDIYVYSSSLPSVQEVLAQKQTKPEPLAKIGSGLVSPFNLCVGISKFALMTRHPEKRIETDFAEQDEGITRAFNESFRISVDGWSPLYPLSENLLRYPAPINICAVIRNFGIGQHVARVEFKSPSGQAYSYTWVFEVKADGIVPEVTATASQ